MPVKFTGFGPVLVGVASSLRLRGFARGLALAAGLTVLAAPISLRAAGFEDSMAQRVLACTGCHGREGRAAADGYYPRIAGKPAGYLYNQLLAFRDGRRHYELMNGLLAPLGDNYLREIAEHFAALDLPWPAPAAATETEAVRARGEALVRRGDTARGLPACTACHGEAMTGLAPAIPGLVGLPRDYLNAQLGAWKAGKRQALAPDCMARIAARLEAADIVAVSAWLAAQTVPPHATALAAAANEAVALPLACGGISAAGAPASAAR